MLPGVTNTSETILKAFLTHAGEEAVPYKPLRDIISRYMTADEFLQGAMAKHDINDDLWDTYGYNLTNINKIAEYRIKKSKNGKVNDPRTKAIIDFTDILTTYNKKYINSFTRKNVDYDKESVDIIFTYHGKLCLPFDNCFIFTHVPKKVGQVVEITHDGRGNYSGNFYLFVRLGAVLQAKFTITRKDNDWEVKFTLPYRQRPLGGAIPNISVIVMMLCYSSKKYLEDISEGNKHIQLEFLAASDIFTGMMCILESLDSYKSKFIYKLNKDKTNVYLYTDKPEIEEFVDNHYPDFNYEQLDSWIVNGYWNFLPKGQSGRDKNGKLIPGLDWVIPYNTDVIDNEEINGQQAKKVKIHAIERAKQRYNLDFNNEDLKKIADECLTKGRLLSIKDRFGKVYTSKSCYRVNYENTILDVALDYGLDKSVRVATFLPKPNDTNYLIIDSKQYNEIQNDISK